MGDDQLECQDSPEVLLKLLGSYKQRHNSDLTAAALWCVVRSQIGPQGDAYFSYSGYQLLCAEPNGGFLADIHRLEQRGLIRYHHTDVIELGSTGVAVAGTLRLPSALAELERKVLEIRTV